MHLSDEQAVLLITTLGPTMVALVFHLAALGYQALLPHLPANRRALVQSIATAVVAKVEASSQGLAGPDKKEKATKMLEGMLSDLGVHVSEEVVSACIEVSVAAMAQATPAMPTSPQPAV